MKPTQSEMIKLACLISAVSLPAYGWAADAATTTTTRTPTTTTTTVAPTTTTTRTPTTTTTTTAPATTTTSTTTKVISTTSATVTSISTAELCSNRIGVNLGGVAYHESEAPFVDLMKMSYGWQRPWGTQYESEPILTNASYYPVEISPSASLVKLVHSDNWARPATENRYLLTWDGVGKLVPAPGMTKVLTSSANQLTFQVITPGQYWVDLKSTDKNNPVRNIKLVPIDASNNPTMTGTFRQRFVDSLAPMKVLRFMQWNVTNNSKVKEWADRRKPDDSSQAFDKKGVAYEYQIELANLTGKDLWVNIPHEASNDYVRQMARLFSNKLDPKITVYVEYTNEAWNWGFTQTKYMDDLGKKLGVNMYQAYSARALETFEIWKAEFARPDKLKVILAGQFANPWITDQILSYKDAGHKVDGFAVGYYIGGDIPTAKNYDWLMQATPEDVISRLKSESIPFARIKLVEQRKATLKYGIPLLAYEAGQHLVADGTAPDGKALVDNQKITDLLIATNRHEGMKDIYSSLLYEWKSVGGGPILLFATTAAPSKWGSWGLREDGSKSVEESPKLAGVYKHCGW